jgi:hypothetical protein
MELRIDGADPGAAMRMVVDLFEEATGNVLRAVGGVSNALRIEEQDGLRSWIEHRRERLLRTADARAKADQLIRTENARIAASVVAIAPTILSGCVPEKQADAAAAIGDAAASLEAGATRLSERMFAVALLIRDACTETERSYHAAIGIQDTGGALSAAELRLLNRSTNTLVDRIARSIAVTGTEIAAAVARARYATRTLS